MPQRERGEGDKRSVQRISLIPLTPLSCAELPSPARGEGLHTPADRWQLSRTALGRSNDQNLIASRRHDRRAQSGRFSPTLRTSMPWSATSIAAFGSGWLYMGLPTNRRPPIARVKSSINRRISARSFEHLRQVRRTEQRPVLRRKMLQISQRPV